MRAIVLDGAGHSFLRDVPAPEPGPGEALIDILFAGICGTDLQLAGGYMGFSGIPGHEFVGVVRSVGAQADKVLMGQRVVGEINLGCDECPRCEAGDPRLCPRRRVLGILNKDGAFADRITLPVSSLHAVPSAITDRQAVFVEPLAAAFQILEQVAVSREDRVLVLGDGRLGLLAGQALATCGCDVTIAGHHDAKLALARELGLATARGLEDACPDMFDLVVEATGAPEGLVQALRHVRPRGTLVMKSTTAAGMSFPVWRAVVDEVTLVGSRCGRFGPALAALAGGTVKVDRLVSAELTLDDGVRALARAGERDLLKVLIRVAS